MLWLMPLGWLFASPVSPFSHVSHSSQRVCRGSSPVSHAQLRAIRLVVISGSSFAFPFSHFSQPLSEMTLGFGFASPAASFSHFSHAFLPVL
eukprot:4787503-Pyramimonas_sp.AAC.1